MSERVSVIIPCYRQASTLTRAVESVLAQNDPDTEIIIVNDGCPDDSAEVAEALAARYHCIRVVHQENAGRSHARNTGLRQASGKWIHFLDCDDWLRPGMFDAFHAQLAREPAADLAYTGVEMQDHAGRPIWQLPPPQLPANLTEALLDRNFIMIHMLWCRRDQLLGIGGFDTSLTHCEDWDLWIRLARTGAKATRVDGIHAVYCKHPPGSFTSATSNFAAMIQAGYRVLERHHTSAASLARARRNIRHDFFQAYLRPELDELSRRRHYLEYLRTLTTALLVAGPDLRLLRSELVRRWSGLARRLASRPSR